MVFDNMRFQIASILFLSIMCITYVRYTKLPIMSTKCFSMMLVSTLICEIMDLTTVFTISHMDSLPSWVNLIAHQIFIGMLDVSIYFLFLYLFILGKHQKRPSGKQYFLISIPILVAIAMVMMGSINFVCNENGVYSYGSMPTTVYIVAAVYLSGMLIMTLFPGHFSFSRQSKVYIWIA